MSSTACLLSKSDVDWWGRAASRPRLQKRFPNAHPLSSPDPLRGGAKIHSPCRRQRKRFPNARPPSSSDPLAGGGSEKTQSLPEATKTVSERPSPLRSPVGTWSHVPNHARPHSNSNVSRGGGAFPPPQRHWKRFPMSQPGGGAFPPSPIHGHGLLSIPPPAETLETVSDVYRGLPPPATFELGWGRALLGTWLHLPTGLRRGGGRLETVLMSRLWSIVIYPCAHRHWIWRRDGRSETVFVGSAKRHAR